MVKRQFSKLRLGVRFSHPAPKQKVLSYREDFLFLWIERIEQERGRENSSFRVEEGMGKPWVSQES